MAERLAGRVAIVTECGQGDTYGRVWARALARAGASVLVADRDATQAAALADELTSAGHLAGATALDVTNDASCAACAALARKRFGRIDVLVNTHHLWHDLRRDDHTDAYLHAVLDYNAISLLRMVRAVLPTMRPQGAGRIISLSSIGAWEIGQGAAETVRQTAVLPSFAYPASKVLQNGLTRFLAGALGQFGITVNAIAPGMISSPGTLAQLSAAEREAFVRRTALGRLLDVRDTEGTLLYLASDDSAMTTGQVVVVDAGLVMLG